MSSPESRRCCQGGGRKESKSSGCEEETGGRGGEGAQKGDRKKRGSLHREDEEDSGSGGKASRAGGQRREKKSALRKWRSIAKKTEALIQQQADLAEKNRLIMLERETRVQAQMQEKKEQKRKEVAEARAKAKSRIDAAIKSAIAIQDQKKADFYARQAKAEELARENAKLEKVRVKEAMEARERKAKVAYDRLVGAMIRERNGGMI